MCVLRLGSLRKAGAWQAPQIASAKQPAELQSEQQPQCREPMPSQMQLPKTQGSAAQHPLSRHRPAAPPTLPTVQTCPLPTPPKIVAQNDCLLSSACGQSMFALQGNQPQAAAEHTVKAPHLSLGVCGLFYLSCPSSFSTHLLKHPALQESYFCVLLFVSSCLSSKTQMLIYKYMDNVGFFVLCEGELEKFTYNTKRRQFVFPP